jgi:membrane-associated phospholipid phosphatase
VGQSILCQLGSAAALGRLALADDRAAGWLNAAARRSERARAVAGLAARWLAVVEVGLMAVLALAGRRRSAVRMLGAVGLVYVASEALGWIWPRARPFARLAAVEAIVPHALGRSFPSRHVASGLAMAAVGGRVHRLLGAGMALVAGLLGVSRVAAGLHYPSDVLAGALLGAAIGRLLRERKLTVG